MSPRARQTQDQPRSASGHRSGPDPDPEAVMRDLLEQHSASVYRVARSVVRDPALAEDVVQETFIKAWQRADTWSGAVPIRNWLLRIAHNVAVSTLRTIRDEATDPTALPTEGSATARPDSVVEDRMMVLDALASLDPTSRSILVLREVEGLSYDEIGEIMGLPLPSVKTRLFRARGRLRKMAEEQA